MIPGVRIVSLFTGVMSTIGGTVYLGPEGLVRRPLGPNQTSVVQVIESAGPVWPVLFLACGLALIHTSIIGHRTVTIRTPFPRLSIITCPRLVLVHIAAVFVFAFYGAALLVGALQSQPPAPVVTAVWVIGIAWIHIGMVIVHQQEGP